MVVLLLVQFLLGMATNLYVTIPTHQPGTTAGNYASGLGSDLAWAVGSGPLPLAIHAALGSALVLVGIATVVLAARARRTAWIVTSAVGLVAILAAWFNGLSFINLGQPNFNSMIMSGGFAVAVACYVSELYLGTSYRPDRHRNQ